METDPAFQSFVKLLTGHQLPLARYLMVILGDSESASTVLQETNVVLLEKWKDFTPDTSFSAWARRVAYLQALAFVRDKSRERLVFSEETIHLLAERVDVIDDISEERMALRHCLSHLQSKSLNLIQQKYRDGCTITELANQLGKGVSATKVSLHRIRRSLMNCIKKQLAESQ